MTCYAVKSYLSHFARISKAFLIVVTYLYTKAEYVSIFTRHCFFLIALCVLAHIFFAQSLRLDEWLDFTSDDVDYGKAAKLHRRI